LKFRLAREGTLHEGPEFRAGNLAPGIEKRAHGVERFHGTDDLAADDFRTVLGEFADFLFPRAMLAGAHFDIG